MIPECHFPSKSPLENPLNFVLKVVGDKFGQQTVPGVVSQLFGTLVLDTVPCFLSVNQYQLFSVNHTVFLTKQFGNIK